MTFAIAEPSSRSRRVESLEHRVRGARLATAMVLPVMHRDRDHKWSTIAKSKFVTVNSDLYSQTRNFFHFHHFKHFGARILGISKGISCAKTWVMISNLHPSIINVYLWFLTWKSGDFKFWIGVFEEHKKFFKIGVLSLILFLFEN